MMKTMPLSGKDRLREQYSQPSDWKALLVDKEQDSHGIICLDPHVSLRELRPWRQE